MFGIHGIQTVTSFLNVRKLSDLTSVQQKYAMDHLSTPPMGLLRNRVVELDIFAKRNEDVAGADCWRETAADAGGPGAAGWRAWWQTRREDLWRGRRCWTAPEQ
ncbi:hypothetical protein BDZ91DRAFT_765173 [Kalaharituber pfeilii]|nr:hypothetical protein BDZ91DRAFT_765173 [Kalaharituber pfeilii]